MPVKAAVDKFYYTIMLGELRRMHTSNHLPAVSHNSLLYLNMIDLTSPNCTVSSLAEQLRVSKSAVTMKVRDLEKQGLVEKIRCENDKRVFHLRINPVYVEEARRFDRVMDRAVRNLRKKYEKKDIDTFCAVLRDLGEEYAKEMV